VEFDITNTTTAAVQLTPSLFLVDRIRIRNGTSNILQEATSDQIYTALRILQLSSNKLTALPNFIGSHYLFLIVTTNKINFLIYKLSQIRAQLPLVLRQQLVLAPQ